VREAAADSGIPPANQCPNWFTNLSFSSPSTGWIATPCGAVEPELFVTYDGGVKWSLLKLQSPSAKWVCQCYTNPPIFFGESRGIIQVNDMSGQTKLLTTSDGGRTWQVLTSPPGGYWSMIDLADADHFWELVIPEGSWNKACGATEPAIQSICPGKPGPPRDWLYSSSDGGRTWAVVERNLPIGVAYAFLFIDATHAIVDEPQGGVITNAPDILLTTPDRGHTWESIEPQGLPSPCC
jgi:photosystem II stability/assembly factor-like uncharacterized protein